MTVIPFPTPNTVEKTSSVNIVDKTIADNIVFQMLTSTLFELINNGVDTETEQFNTDFVFLTGVCMALVYRAKGIEHPLHKIMSEYRIVNDIN